MIKYLWSCLAFALSTYAIAEDDLDRMIKELDNSPIPSSYIVYDFTNRKVLENHNEHTVMPIASITKLMTAHVFLKYNQNMNCQNMITDEDTDHLKNTKTRLPKYTPIPCSSLLEAMLVGSDNYAASALSRSIPYFSKQQFVELMNRQAQEWNMTNTRFVDPSGLSPNNVSTTYDLLILSSHLANNQVLQYISNTKTTNIGLQKTSVSYKNTNRLVRENMFSAALSKTGYIKESGYNLLFVNGNYCDDKMIAVISLNNASSQNRSTFTSRILNKYSCMQNSF